MLDDQGVRWYWCMLKCVITECAMMHFVTIQIRNSHAMYLNALQWWMVACNVCCVGSGRAACTLAIIGACLNVSLLGVFKFNTHVLNSHMHYNGGCMHTTVSRWFRTIRKYVGIGACLNVPLLLGVR